MTVTGTLNGTETAYCRFTFSWSPALLLCRHHGHRNWSPVLFTAYLLSDILGHLAILRRGHGFGFLLGDGNRGGDRHRFRNVPGHHDGDRHVIFLDLLLGDRDIHGDRDHLGSGLGNLNCVLNRNHLGACLLHVRRLRHLVSRQGGET